jgi:hypothetical protein
VKKYFGAGALIVLDPTESDLPKHREDEDEHDDEGWVAPVKSLDRFWAAGLDGKFI